MKERVARLLLHLQCVQLSVDKPFQYASGLFGPIYCDNRKILSFVREREQIVDDFILAIDSSNIEFDLVAGVATAGIPHAALIAAKLKKPMIYIRGKAKDYGRKNQIEGSYLSQQKIVLIEDLVNQAKSLMEVIDCSVAHELMVKGCFSIVDYQTPAARERLENLKIPLYSLTDFSTLVKQAEKERIITRDQLDLLWLWHQDPVKWSDSRPRS